MGIILLYSAIRKRLFHFIIIRIKNYVDFLILQPALRAVRKDLFLWRKSLPYALQPSQL